MKKQVIALTLTIATILGCCGFAASVETTEPIVEYVEKVVEVEVEKNYTIERIENFTDKGLSTYTKEQLQDLINAELEKQEEAHELAESARALGWPADSDALVSAGNQWWNSQLAIEVYEARYEEVLAEEVARWEAKKAKYPAATEIWLYMKELGWNDYVCAGIMGNLMAEVGGQTLNIKYGAYGSNYYGMCQWNKAYSQIWGKGLAEQCDFLRDTIKYELDTFGYAYAKGFNYNSFLNMTNERDAAKAFAKCYERCGSSSYGVRMSNATKAYNYFVNN